jgi:hypothetical protein
MHSQMSDSLRPLLRLSCLESRSRLLSLLLQNAQSTTHGSREVSCALDSDEPTSIQHAASL